MSYDKDIQLFNLCDIIFFICEMVSTLRIVVGVKVCVHRTYNIMVKDKPVPNVYPVIYTPNYITDQFKTYGENEVVDQSNNAYWGTEWIPSAKDRAKATLMLSHLYKMTTVL